MTISNIEVLDIERVYNEELAAWIEKLRGHSGTRKEAATAIERFEKAMDEIIKGWQKRNKLGPFRN